MFITAEDPRCVVPADMLGKPRTMAWVEYCTRLALSVDMANGGREVKLTIHVNVKELGGVMRELEPMLNVQVNRQQLDHLNDIVVAGVMIRCDIPGFV